MFVCVCAFHFSYFKCEYNAKKVTQDFLLFISSKSLHLYTVFIFIKHKKISKGRCPFSWLHITEVCWTCPNAFMVALYSSVMNSESLDHVVDVASWLFRQHMFLIPSFHILTHSNSPMSAIRGLLVFICVYVHGRMLERVCLSVHLCLWGDGAVVGRLCHVCVLYMSVCVWDRITDGLECVREAAVSQLVVIFHEAYETQLVVCVSLVYFRLSNCGTAHCVWVCVRLPTVYAVYQWGTVILCPLAAGSTIPVPSSPTNHPLPLPCVSLSLSPPPPVSLYFSLWASM